MIEARLKEGKKVFDSKEEMMEKLNREACIDIMMTNMDRIAAGATCTVTLPVYTCNSFWQISEAIKNNYILVKSEEYDQLKMIISNMINNLKKDGKSNKEISKLITGLPEDMIDSLGEFNYDKEEK